MIDRQTEGQIDRQKDRQTERRIDRQTEGQIDRQKDRQTDILVYREIHSYDEQIDKKIDIQLDSDRKIDMLDICRQIIERQTDKQRQID